MIIQEDMQMTAVIVVGQELKMVAMLEMVILIVRVDVVREIIIKFVLRCG